MSETKEIIFGTKNPAKIEQVRGVLSPLGISVVGLGEFGRLPDVEEDGDDVVDNAVKKAVVYARAFGRTVFSMDNGLYFDDLPANQQPGTHVRRINGEDRPTDDELLAYYVKLVEDHGGAMKSRWEYGLAIAHPDGNFVSSSLISPRLFTGKPSSMTVEGYPLESLQIDPTSGEYVSEMSEEQRAAYWQKVIGGPLSKFVVTNT
jgi:8-oxo-dGTP diphosphatase